MRRPYKHIDLEDMFSDFEHTPDDSNWNNISGGLNSKKAAGNLSEVFTDFQVSPSKDVWAEISAINHPKRKKRGVILWWTSGIAASLAGIFVVSSIFNTSVHGDLSVYEPRLSTNDQIAWSPYSEDTSIADHLTNDHNTSTEHSDLADNGLEKMNDDSFNKNLQSTSVNNYNVSNEHYPDETALVNHLEEDSVTGFGMIKQVNFDLAENEDHYSVLPDQPLFINDMAEMTIRTSAISVGQTKSGLVGVPIISWPVDPLIRPDSDESNNSLLASTQFSSGVQQPQIQSFDLALDPNTVGFGDNENLLSFTPNSNLENFVSRENFNIPIYITINFEKRLKTGYKNRFRPGIGGGLLLVNSSISYSGSIIKSKTEISRTYVAVPLYLKYDFISKKKWSLYSSIGGTSEFGIAGKSTLKDYENGEVINTTTTRFKLGIGQFNVNLGMGGNVYFSKHISAFSEVSVAHYFYQSGYTIWSSKNLWPSLKTGISIQF